MRTGESGSAVFLTFSGNCRKALSFYQSCFGGRLQLEELEPDLQGFPEKPVVLGSLVSGYFRIYGSDLVPEAGRRPGNHIAIFLKCGNARERRRLLKKLIRGQVNSEKADDGSRLIEIVDGFDVRWVLGL